MNSNNDKTDGPNSNSTRRAYRQRDLPHRRDSNKALARRFKNSFGHLQDQPTEQAKRLENASLGPWKEWHQEVFPWIDHKIEQGVSLYRAYKCAYVYFKLKRRNGITNPDSVKTGYQRYRKARYETKMMHSIILKKWDEAASAFRSMTDDEQRKYFDKLF